MSEIEKYLDLLELPQGASWDDITRSYRELIKVWHPDRFPHDEKLRERAEIKSRELNEAVRQLRRHHRRTQLYRRSELNDAIKSAADASAAKPRDPLASSRVFQTNIKQHFHPRTSESGIYDSLLKRQRRVSRLTHVAAFCIFSVSIVLFGSLGLPARPDFFRAWFSKPTPPLRELHDYRAVALLQPKDPAAPQPFEHVWAPDERPPLVDAAANCRVGALNELLRHGQDVNSADSNGDTALAWAIRMNCIPAAKMLLQSGANQHTVAKNGFTPRDWAVWAKNGKLLSLLN